MAIVHGFELLREHDIGNYRTRAQLFATPRPGPNSCPSLTRMKTRSSASHFAPPPTIQPAWPTFWNIRCCAVRASTRSRNPLWNCSRLPEDLSHAMTYRTRPATRWPARICRISTTSSMSIWMPFLSSTHPFHPAAGRVASRTDAPDGELTCQAWF